jgi:hypothetical protein
MSKGGSNMKKSVFPFLFVAIVFVLAAITLWGQNVTMTVGCPQCGENATFTGGRKLAGNGSVCEYSHFYVGNDGKMVKHVFWQNCESK